MSAQILDGREVSRQVRRRVKSGVAAFAAETGITPCLAVIIVGEDPASQVYVRNKKIACEKCGILSREYALPESTTQEELVALLEELNRDPAVHGILVQHLPKVPDYILHIVSSVILIVAVLGIFALISSLLTHVAETVALGWINRVLGMILSLGVSALTIGFLVLIFDTLNERFSLVDSPWLRESVLYPLFRDGANALFPMLKGWFSNAMEATTSAITTV